MTELLDRTKRRKWALNVLLFTIAFLHVIVIILVIAAVRADKNMTDTSVLASMFSTSMWGIGISILLLISDKAVDAFLSRFAANSNQSIGKEDAKSTD